MIKLVKYLVADRKIRRLLRTAPHRALADTGEDEFVRVTGTVEPYDARMLEAPLSGRICAYYSLVVLKRRGFAPAGALATEQEAMPFILQQGSQRAVIDPAHAQISSDYDYKENRMPIAFDSRQRSLLVRHGHGMVIEELLFREATLAIGERIVVFGAATREPDPEASVSDGGYREARPTRLRFTGTARFPLVISDDPRSL